MNSQIDFSTLFTEKELKVIAYAPALAANGMAMVDGNISEQETLTISANLLDATDRYRHNDLIMLSIRSFTKFMQDGDMPGDIRYISSPEEYIRAFRNVARIIDQKVNNAEGHEYKKYLVEIMLQVASSSSGTRKHSFFGKGNVSGQEQVFLEHIAEILSVE